MDENRNEDRVLILMKNLNFLIILYISFFMSYSLSGYLQENSALDFLTRVHRLPMAAWKLPAVTLCLYGSVLFLMKIKSSGSLGMIGKVFTEIFLCYWISYILGFSYTGTILLILADTIQHLPKSKRRNYLAVLICFAYLLADFNLVSAGYEIISLDTYLAYFRGDIREILLGVKNVLSSLNTFIFIVYMILIVRIQMDETERILSLNEELRKANLRLEEYARESEIMVATRERNRLAREIHDTLGHALTGIITGLEACTALLEVAPEAAKKQLTAIAEVARKGMTDVRRSVKALRPDALEKLHLEKAILETIEGMRSATNAQIDYQCSTKLNGFNEDEEEIIYRIVQESITNSIRHGKANKISVHIDREFQMLRIVIKDNGVGCPNVKKGFGLSHMAERLEMLQGSLHYHGEDGFTVEAQLPIRWGTED